MPTFVRGTRRHNLYTPPGGALNTDDFAKIDLGRSILADRFSEIDFPKSIWRNRFSEIDFGKSIWRNRVREIDFRKSICQNLCRHSTRSISENRCARIADDIAFFPGHFLVLFLSHLAFHTFLVLSAGYKLPGIVSQRATSVSAVQLVQGLSFCSLPYTFCYIFVNVCAFSEPRARAKAL